MDDFTLAFLPLLILCGGGIVWCLLNLLTMTYPSEWWPCKIYDATRKRRVYTSLAFLYHHKSFDSKCDMLFSYALQSPIASMPRDNTTCDIVFANGCTAKNVWNANWPYCFGSMDSWDSQINGSTVSGRPSRKTLAKLKNAIDDYYLIEQLNKEKV